MSGSFDGWRQSGDSNWRIEDSEFVADSGSGHLVTTEDFSDFQIQLEFWTDEVANSGVFIRASDPERFGPNNSYEINIFDTRPDQTYRTGGIVFFAEPSVSINTSERWNTYDITADGDDITIILNGVTVVDISDDSFQDGPLTLQYGAGVVRFRNIRIRRL
jgi:hypothetical protein